MKEHLKDFQVGDAYTITEEPNSWCDRTGGKYGVTDVRYPYTFTITKVELVQGNFSNWISIRDNNNYGWCVDKNELPLFVKTNSPKQLFINTIAIKDSINNLRPLEKFLKRNKYIAKCDNHYDSDYKDLYLILYAENHYGYHNHQGLNTNAVYDSVNDFIKDYPELNYIPPEPLHFAVKYCKEFTEDLFNATMKWCKENYPQYTRYEDEVYIGGDNYKNLSKGSLRYFKFSCRFKHYGVDNNLNSAPIRTIDELKQIINYSEPAHKPMTIHDKWCVKNSQRLGRLYDICYDIDVYENSRYVYLISEPYNTRMSDEQPEGFIEITEEAAVNIMTKEIKSRGKVSLIPSATTLNTPSKEPVLEPDCYYEIVEDDFWMIGRAKNSNNGNNKIKVYRSDCYYYISSNEALHRNQSWCYSAVNRTFTKLSPDDEKVKWLEYCAKQYKFVSLENYRESIKTDWLIAVETDNNHHPRPWCVKHSPEVGRLLDKLRDSDIYKNSSYLYLCYPIHNYSHMHDHMPPGYVEISEQEAIDRLRVLFNLPQETPEVIDLPKNDVSLLDELSNIMKPNAPQKVDTEFKLYDSTENDISI